MLPTKSQTIEKNYLMNFMTFGPKNYDSLPGRQDCWLLYLFSQVSHICLATLINLVKIIFISL